LILTTGGLVALACQMPGGALVDAVRSARLVAVLAVAAICLSALALAIWPTFLVVMAAPGLPAGAGCGPRPLLAPANPGLRRPACAVPRVRRGGVAAGGPRRARMALSAPSGPGRAAGGGGAPVSLSSNGAFFSPPAAGAAPAILALARIRMADVERPRDTHV